MPENYRCGGCKGLVEEYTKKRRCGVCDGIWRKYDDDVVACSQCKLPVHTGCDSVAAAYLREKHFGTRAGSEKYECAACRRQCGPDTEGGNILRKQLHSQAWAATQSGMDHNFEWCPDS